MKSLVGESAKAIIEREGLKQCAVARKAGYSAQMFNAMLNGRKQIKDTDIANIATALNVTPNELFGFDCCGA